MSGPAIDWRVHFAASHEEVWEAWETYSGRVRFWAERSLAGEGGFEL